MDDAAGRHGREQHGVQSGTGAARGMDDADAFTLEGVEFVPAWSRPSRDGSLTLLKSRRMVDVYASLFDGLDRPRIVELGISQGGSVALFALMTRPTSLVAVDLSPDRIAPLDRFIADKGLEGVVSAHYGVDQADKARLTELVDASVGGEPLDLVIDDASHRYTPTVASFECLFPRLRPGGRYVIEDWTTQDVLGVAMRTYLAAAAPGEREALQAQIDAARTNDPPDAPMSLIAIELVLARGQSRGGIRDVTVDEDWITVTRDDSPLDPSTYRLRDAYDDHLGILADPLAPERAAPS